MAVQHSTVRLWSVLPASAVCVGKKRPTLAFCISAEHLTGPGRGRHRIRWARDIGRRIERSASLARMGQWARQAGLLARMGLFWHGRARTERTSGMRQGVSKQRLGRGSDAYASELTPVRSNPPRTGLGCEYLMVGDRIPTPSWASHYVRC